MSAGGRVLALGEELLAFESAGGNDCDGCCGDGGGGGVAAGSHRGNNSLLRCNCRYLTRAYRCVGPAAAGRSWLLRRRYRSEPLGG